MRTRWFVLGTLLSTLTGCSAESTDDPVGTVRQASLCGPTEDFQDVERYDGSYGPTTSFVARKQRPVGELRWRTDLAARYTDPGDVGATPGHVGASCSATLIASDLLITAGHCFVENSGWRFPRINGTDTPISPSQAAREIQVFFDYQVDASGTLRPTQVYDVVELVEHVFLEPPWVDYAIVRVAGAPGFTHGTTPISISQPAPGAAVTIIGHPEHRPKKISAGHVTMLDENRLFYDVDTLGGNSGSGVIDDTGALVAVHANPGCPGDGNNGTRMDVIYARSATLQALARSDYAFAWSQNTTGTFTADPTYSRNSSGSVANTVTNYATGKYAITFPNLKHRDGGNTLVTAYGSGSERCNVEQEGTDSGSDRTVYVDCYTSSGALTNTRFVVSYVRNGIMTGDGQGAYLWSRITGTVAHAWNSSGGLNRVDRISAGNYLVTLPGQAPPPRGGTVQVTAFNSSGHCKAGAWAASGSNMLVSVRCFAASGAAADSEFMMYYSPLRASGGSSGGYAYANDPTAASYAPSDAYEFIAIGSAATGGHVTATRFGTGVYALGYPGLSALGSSALVTAYGATPNYCKVSSWSGSTSNATVNVRCFNQLGSLVDTPFVSNYTTSQAP